MLMVQYDLSKVRKDLNMTQKEFAEAIGISLSKLRRAENDFMGIPLHMYLAVRGFILEKGKLPNN